MKKTERSHVINLWDDTIFLCSATSMHCKILYRGLLLRYICIMHHVLYIHCILSIRCTLGLQ